MATVENQRIQALSKVCAGSAMTDVTTTGTIDFATGSIPAGALVLGWKAVCTTAFAGDTTAIIQVGVAGDLDRYSAVTTGSVFAAGTKGAVALASKAALGISAVVTPRVTITTTSDFTLTVAGVVTVTIYFIATE